MTSENREIGRLNIKSFFNRRFPRRRRRSFLNSLLKRRVRLKFKLNLLTLPQRNFTPGFCSEILSNVSPVHNIRWRNLKTQQSPVILDLSLWETQAGKSHHYSDPNVLEKIPFQNVFRPLRKQKPGFFKFFQFGERFRKALISSRISLLRFIVKLWVFFFNFSGDD